MGLPGRQQGSQRPGGAVGGRPGTAGEGTYFNRLLTHTPASGQSGGVLTEEERALKERDGSIMAQTRGTCPGCHTADPRPRHELPENGVDQDHEAQHDRRVPVPPRLREVQPELEVKTHSHLSDQNQKPDIWLVDKCKAIDVGVIQPRQMDAYYNEKVKKYRDETDGSLHPKSKRHLEELYVDVEKLSVRAAFAIAHMAAEANEHPTKLIRRAGPKAWSPRATASCHPTSDNRMSPSPGPDDNDREGAQDWTRSRVESQPGENAPLAAADLYGQY
eukprot:XP_001703946.1 Reverse transcriptase/endonuclease, putative [Giardia lamblia ATCC 50803]